MRTVVRRRPRRRLVVDGYELKEQWIKPDPWSWIY